MKNNDIILGGLDNQLKFNKLSFGGLEIGWWRKYVQKEDAIELVQKAYDMGIRTFDTSTLYGALRSEFIIGDALEGIDRSTYTLSSKAGYDVTGFAPDFCVAPYVVPTNYSYDFIMRSVEGSLKRLKTDYLDICHIHDTSDEDDYAQVMDGAYRALSDLKKQGVIRAIGAGNKFNNQLKNAAVNGDFDAFLVACRYSLLDHEDFLNEIQPLCEQKNISIMAGGVFSSGLASNPYAPNPVYDYFPASPEMVQKAQNIDQICKKYGVTIRQAAAHFPLFNPMVKTVVLGTGSMKNFLDNYHTMYNLDIPVALWHELKDRGFISSKAFIPEL